MKMVAKTLLSIPIIATVIKAMVKCSSVSKDEARIKCSDRAGKDVPKTRSPENNQKWGGTTRCKNGGGQGQNWLWTERINTRLDPKYWTEVVPDSSECHDQQPAPGGKPGDPPAKIDVHKMKACRNTHSPAAHALSDYRTFQFCSDRFFYGLKGDFDHPCKPRDAPKCIRLTKQQRAKCGRCFGSLIHQNTTACSELTNTERAVCVPCEPKDLKSQTGKVVEGSGVAKCESEGTHEREFWREFNFDTMTHRCEFDNRCMFYDMTSHGATQGRYRCVPRVHIGDPRLYRTLGSPIYNRHNKKIGIFKAVDRILSSTSDSDAKTKYHQGNFNGVYRIHDFQSHLAKWQRASQPYYGGSNGVILANLPGGTDENMLKAHQKTGDICIRYGLNDKFAEEADPFLPPTRVRCLSEQFRFFSDEVNMAICMGYEPSKIGKIFMDKFLIPLLTIMPGGLSNFIGPAFAGIIGMYAMEALDAALSNLPFFFGKIYAGICSLFLGWTQFNFRNILTTWNPRSLMAANMGTVDMGIDGGQDRMDVVLGRRTKAQGCNAKVKSFGNSCPEAIPIRGGLIAGARAGDFTDTPYTTAWPGRNWVFIGTNKASVAMMKGSMCLKPPICDTVTAKIAIRRYGGMYRRGRSVDCSGRGICVWNMERGNHCKCDRGYRFVDQCMRCCKEGTPKSECCRPFFGTKKNGPKTPKERKVRRKARRKVSKLFKPLKSAIDKIHRMDAATALDEAALDEATAAMKKGKKAQEAAKSKIALLEAAASATRIGTHRVHAQIPSSGKQEHSSSGEGGLELGENDDDDSEVEKKGSTGDMREYRDSITSKKVFSLYGHQLVSTRCRPHQTQEQCRSVIGCAWKKRLIKPSSAERTATEVIRYEDNITANGTNSENYKLRRQAAASLMSCQDAAEWRCTVKKKILNCGSHKTLSPSEMSSVLDSYCGNKLLKQKLLKKNMCKFGVRVNERCESWRDCPLGSADMRRRLYQNPRSKNFRGTKDGPKLTKGEFKGKYSHAPCNSQSYRVGCTLASFKNCKEMGYDTITAMIV